MWPGPYGEWGSSQATSKIATGTGDRSRRSNQGGRHTREEAKERSQPCPHQCQRNPFTSPTVRSRAREAYIVTESPRRALAPGHPALWRRDRWPWTAPHSRVHLPVGGELTWSDGKDSASVRAARTTSPPGKASARVPGVSARIFRLSWTCSAPSAGSTSSRWRETRPARTRWHANTRRHRCRTSRT
jgi:hypothetical protein